ncbi:hypothetical protein [Helicobacter mustelae]|uniref:Flagellar protein FlgN n=1 Tax=Helicobacter mustelae (strain ATCC 43772 / CCUG 25715 / CIP 103759 / LMG 18044 / NCTC 12198 / R85-136P) TaxID=679897 RepID=D3UGU0_HELM1|nr:hypothetical protein [Helicobacter mustelae]CBG39711.1 hypothetical protein Cj1465 [Helicobacter mustelae 12198]SQH71217.1 Uncharacterised protein [Helicobacter mustelae]STP12345.1 Uncharacterised protein [Helicobacter mustelae]
MLYKYLRGAISDLDALISLTECDIQDIQEANHDAVFARNLEKQPLILSFENKKNMAQQEILNLRDSDSQKSLAELLDDEVNILLEQMKQKLQNLKNLNTNYARMVFAVSEFYSSLLHQIVPHEVNGYSGPRTAQSTFLKIRV